jgi:hypothetical protein
MVAMVTLVTLAVLAVLITPALLPADLMTPDNRPTTPTPEKSP